MDNETRLTIRAFGLPAPQGSKKASVIHGRAILRESSANVAPWRQDVAAAARETIKRHRDEIRFPINEPVRARCEFLFPRPKSHYGSGSRAEFLTPSAPYWITAQNKGDLDKVLRSTWDGLSRSSGGALLQDDSIVVQVEACKRYCGVDEQPGAIIEITAAVPVSE